MTDRPGIFAAGRTGLWAVLLSVGLMAGGAVEAREWPSAPLRGQVTEQPPCSCRSPTGRPIELGQETCLRTAAGAKRARCVMVINNTSWQLGQDGCDPDQELTN